MILFDVNVYVLILIIEDYFMRLLKNEFFCKTLDFRIISTSIFIEIRVIEYLINVTNQYPLNRKVYLARLSSRI